MADEVKSGDSQELLPWNIFLESHPPGSTARVDGMAKHAQTGYSLTLPAIRLYCSSATCQKIMSFDCAEFSSDWVSSSKWNKAFLSYVCRHCKEAWKVFAVSFRLEAGVGVAFKIGEVPPFGPHIPTKMFSLLGEDQELFHKGRRSESQGLGIGAYAYYRRVVENQKSRLIGEILKVSQLLKAPPETIANLEAAMRETQFSRAVGIVKDGIPDALKISGHNPLTLLHDALSDGLHDKSDDECLARAEAIRIVMANLAELIVEALKDRKELNAAVAKLLQYQSGGARVPKRGDSKPANGSASA